VAPGLKGRAYLEATAPKEVFASFESEKASVIEREIYDAFLPKVELRHNSEVVA
jgi:hypothetical protein